MEQVPVSPEDVDPVSVTSPDSLVTEFINLSGGIPLDPTDAAQRHVMRQVAELLNVKLTEQSGIVPTEAALALAIKEYRSAQEPLEQDLAMARVAATAIALAARRKEERCKRVESSRPSSKPWV